MYFVKRGDTYHDVAGPVVPRPARRVALPRPAGRTGDAVGLEQPSDDAVPRRPAQEIYRDARRRCRPVADADGAAGALGRPASTTRHRSPRRRANWSPTGPPRSARRCATPCPRPRPRGRRSATRPCARIAGRDRRDRAGRPRAPRRALQRRRRRRSVYLAPCRRRCASGMTPAERLLAAWRSDWHGDIGEVFRRRAY